MYDYFFYGASMFPSNGNHFVKAVKSGKMTAVDAVEQLIAGDHIKALGKLMAERELFNAETRKAAYDLVITARNFDCFMSMYENDEMSRRLNAVRLRLLLQLDQAGWQQAFAEVAQRHEYVHTQDMFQFIKMDMPEHVRSAVLKTHTSVSESNLLDYTASYAPDWLRYSLERMQNPPNPNKLAQLCVSVLGSNSDAATVGAAFDLLLSRGMNVNYDNGAVMTAALSKGYTDMAHKLVEAGFEAALCRTAVYERLCAVGAPRAGIDFIKQFMGPTPGDAAKANDGFTRSDDYSVSCVQPLPNGGQLTMVFNFATAQQIVIAQMGEQLAAPTIVPFSRMENRHLLEKAVAAFVADGGDGELAASYGALPRKSPLAKTSQPGG